MRTQIHRGSEAGGIVRRIREDQGVSRAELAKKAGVSPRTLFAFEQGENENVGLAGFLRIASALGLTVAIDDGAAPLTGDEPSSHGPQPFAAEWDNLGDIWRLEEMHDE